MIFTPLDLKEFLTTCVAELEAIKHAKAVIDDSQMVKRLDDIGHEKQLMLFGVLPDYGGDSRDDDALMMDNGLDFLILKKVQHSDLDNDELIDVMQETVMAAREFVKFIYEEKKKPGTCSKFYFLKEGSEQIVPVWAKAGCNGYMVSFNLRTDL